jgi:response regulator RpfG family c-di-GMP phosphodiesterase
LNFKHLCLVQKSGTYEAAAGFHSMGHPDMKHAVLVVDDTQLNLNLFSALLSKLGNCQDFLFADPLQALEWVKLNPVSLILVDYMMPGIDGIEFVRRIRQMPDLKETPILMVTTNNLVDVRHAALDNGATDFLTKPVDLHEFRARVKNMLLLEESRRQLVDRATWLAAEVRQATQEILERERETVVRLSKAAEHRDNETGSHVNRMAHFCALIAAELGLDAEEQELLKDAAPLHDIGKVGIPDHILLKPGKLDRDEFEIMKQHARIGHDILQGSASKLLQLGAVIALSHHEKFDGSGYPGALVGEAIPLCSRVVAVADVFDALTSARPYKPAWSVSDAINYLKQQSGLHFDPRCVNALITRLDDVLKVRALFSEKT